jgi:hypothetical protein
MGECLVALSPLLADTLRMFTEEMLDYIRGNLKAGFTKDAIKPALMASGWSEGDIEAAFSAVGDVRPAPILAEKPVLESRTQQDDGIEIVDDRQTDIPHANVKSLDDASLSELQKQTNVEVLRIEQQARFEAAQEAQTKDFATEETGLYGFMIRNNLANSVQSAQILLGVAGFALLVFLYWIFLH